MKNLSLILNVVLLVAVIVLYYLHFSGGNAPMADHPHHSGGAMNSAIAIVKSDSILEHYDYLKVKKQELEAKTKKLEQEYRTRVEGLQREIANYQQNVSNMTYSQSKAIEEDLGKKQQNLQMYEQGLSQQLMGEEAALNRELYTRVTAFLKEYGEENDLHMVFKYDPTSDLLWAGDTLDITQAVLSGLNKEYSEEGQSTSAKDSTSTK